MNMGYVLSCETTCHKGDDGWEGGGGGWGGEGDDEGEREGEGNEEGEEEEKGALLTHKSQPLLQSSPC